MFRVEHFVGNIGQSKEGKTEEEKIANDIHEGDEMTTSHQRFLLEKAKRECYKRMDQAPSNNSSGLWCNRTWDGIMCWDDTPASTTERQSCPHYIHGFKTSNFAVKTCTEEGVWYFNSKINKTWTDYSSCVQEFSSNFQDHLDRVNSITTFGYGASLVSLSAAIIIMISCRRFHYKSNILHINLFLAFCFRSIFALMRIYLFTYGYAMSIDMEEKGGLLIFKPGSHWQCRLLFTLFHYGIAVSQSWIFIEGLYLQMLFYRTLMTQQRGIKLYIIFGWSFPLLFLIPWVISRIKYDNTLCWNINQRRGILWIIRAPLVLIIVICFLFFIDNIRILFKRTVARMRNRTSRAFFFVLVYPIKDRKFQKKSLPSTMIVKWKLAKFTVMLVPLFGVPNILFILIPADLKTAVDVPYMYISMTYSSFQGLILSFLYCFLHVEVHTAIRQNFNRFLERRRLNLSLRSQTEQTFTNRRKRSFTSMNPCHSYDTEVTSQLQEAHQFVSPQQICTSSLRSDKSRNGLYESECRGQKNSVRQDCVSLIDGNAFPSESIPLSRILETENCSEL